MNENKRKIDMNITINQAILHILDTNINEPVLSDTVLSGDENTGDFLREHISNACESDSIKQCSFYEDSSFYSLLEESGGDFIRFSKLLAAKFFDTMLKNVSVPPCDLIVADLNIDGTPYAGAFKLNYKTAFIHQYSRGDDTNSNSIIKQRTVLPSGTSRADEFFLINMDTMALSVSEKKYEINGEKAFYISDIILECNQNKSEKAKLNEVKKITEKAIKTHYTDDNTVDAAVSALISDETDENILEVEKLKERVAKIYPLAKETFAGQIEEKNLHEEKIYVAPSSAKKLEKQSIRTKNGVVINIPTNLMNDGGVEFINNPDGSVSILIKNVYM